MMWSTFAFMTNSSLLLARLISTANYGKRPCVCHKAEEEEEGGGKKDFLIESKPGKLLWIFLKRYLCNVRKFGE